MKVLVIAAHGSRKKESNIEVEKLAVRLAKKIGNRFDKVVHAFLQIAEPLLETTMTEWVKEGATHMVIFPFFIGSGSHILEDIPNLVEKAKQANPHVEFTLTRQLGKIEAIEDVIINEVIS
ncbi:MAG: CbiX/SirB N-terminal domain-containing protein [Pseudomonadota bacterium]